MNFLNKSHASIVSLSFIYALKVKKRQIKELAKLACIWCYRLTTLAHSKFSDVRFHYFGLKSHQDAIFKILGIDSAYFVSENIKQRAFISGVPIPGSICIPFDLTSQVPLKNRSLDEILLSFDKKKRKLVNKEASRFSLKQVTNIKDVARLNQEMLMPYAFQRHAEVAYQLTSEYVTRTALNRGALNLLIESELEVGCVLSYDFFCRNEHYWLAHREGFPNFIFNDIPRRTKNSVIITYLEIEWALNNGFDYYDLGFSPAFTETGALYYKRTYGTELTARGSYNYFYLKLPKTMAAQFYWEKPIFAVEGKTVVLHLGLPDGVSVDALAQRYKLLNYRGLSKVYLHCDFEPSNIYTDTMLGIYSNQKSPPEIKVSRCLAICMSFLISLNQAYLYSHLDLFAII